MVFFVFHSIQNFDHVFRQLRMTVIPRPGNVVGMPVAGKIHCEDFNVGAGQIGNQRLENGEMVHPAVQKHRTRKVLRAGNLNRKRTVAARLDSTFCKLPFPTCISKNLLSRPDSFLNSMKYKFKIRNKLKKYEIKEESKTQICTN